MRFSEEEYDSLQFIHMENSHIILFTKYLDSGDHGGL